MAEGPETPSSASQPPPPPPPSSSSEKSPQGTIRQQAQVPLSSAFPVPGNGDMQMFPVFYPTLGPSLSNSQNQDQTNRGAGIYAVPVSPYLGSFSGFQSNTLIPLTYNIPTRRVREAGSTGEEQGQVGHQQQNPQQQPAPQRQVVVRRFQIAIQLDLLLILKLAAVIFLFNQDGSRQRLVVLVFFASLIYLYQTGALAPLIRWLSQGMQRAAAPPHPPRPAVRAENVPPAAGQGNENQPLAADGQAGAENENRAVEDDGNQAAENQNAAEQGAENGANHWWGIVKEIQMIVFGFISSLLPGFHNID
ncbi:uncharacterized protein LOC115744601 isoform X2 [Rhodamnia argentea]|uniref:Uncharacterized protein LOC115744601 isoform X2 n=1 Tax=Rhodamnia argentea TaxID=178133 RepID=A0A8B8PLN9_9MYRT|nr:uncharacterized protein LOC115744601 isoform X2 [Rhodamnia argentea]